MGSRENLNNRLPTVEQGPDGNIYTWQRNPDGSGAEVTHTVGDDSVRISYGRKKIDIPRTQVRWLSEVLLQLTDLYQIEYASGAHDDYASPNLDLGDRR